MPTSVLLAVLAAAGLLALAPALVRRYDSTERLVAERALSSARVLACAGTQRYRRRRTVPGRWPVNPPRMMLSAAGAASAASSAAAAAVGAASSAASAAQFAAGAAAFALSSRGAAPTAAASRAAAPAARRRPRRVARSRAVYRRRRVLLALVLLNLAELAGVLLVGPGFWIGFAVAAALLAGYLVHLRNRALADRRRRRVEARYAAWIAARQVAVRRQQARRAAARRELLERELAAREQARRLARRDPRAMGR